MGHGYSQYDNVEKQNDGYFLLVVNILSKFVWTVPLSTKTGREMVQALTHIFSDERMPTNMRSDEGTEFVNKDVKTFLRQHMCVSR